MKSLIKVGNKFPKVKLFENNPGNAVDTESLLKGKKVIVFGVPGAFTPGCSKTHLPGYIADYQKFKSKGVDSIICVSVNDPFVMEAWGKVNNVGDKIKMLADTNGELTRELGVEYDLSEKLGNKRMKRFSMVCEDGTVKVFNLEPEGGGLTCSLSNNLLKLI